MNISQAPNKNCVPPSVLDSLSTWLATQCEQFASGPHPSSCSYFAQPFLEVETPVASPRSPFQNAVVNPVDTSGPDSPIVVSNPFVTVPVAAEPPPSQSTSPFQWPVRLTWFVEMPLDVHYARVNGMIQSGVFEDIGRATIRYVEGGTAWGVWLRIDHCSTAQVEGRDCDRTLSFHDVADDSSQRPQAPDRQMRDDALRSMVHQLIDACHIFTNLRFDVEDASWSSDTAQRGDTRSDSPTAVHPLVPNARVSGDSREAGVPTVMADFGQTDFFDRLWPILVFLVFGPKFLVLAGVLCCCVVLLYPTQRPKP